MLVGSCLHYLTSSQWKCLKRILQGTLFLLTPKISNFFIKLGIEIIMYNTWKLNVVLISWYVGKGTVTIHDNFNLIFYVSSSYQYVYFVHPSHVHALDLLCPILVFRFYAAEVVIGLEYLHCLGDFDLLGSSISSDIYAIFLPILLMLWVQSSEDNIDLQ